LSTYFIAQITIHDRDQYREYEEGFDKVIEGYDGKVLAVDDRPTVLEGTWHWNRVVVIRFSSPDEARRWYDSEAYRTLARIRHQSSDATILLAEGRE
jgi:uncharacterized protein (DUF1330 family)